MKKFLLGCLVLTALAAAALPPLLEKQVEDLTLAGLKTWDSPKPAAADAVRCSFWQRSLTLENLTFAQASAQGMLEHRIATLTVQAPLSLLWDAALLWAGQSPQPRITVAETFRIDTLTSTGPRMKTRCARGHGSGIAVDSTLLRQLMQGAQPQESAQPWKNLSLSETVLEDITVDTFLTDEDAAKAGKTPDMTLTAARYQLRGWDGAVLDTLRMENCAAFGEGQRLMSVQATQYKGLKAPSDDLYVRALRLHDNSPEEEVLAFCKDFFLQPTPFLDSFSVEGLRVEEPLLPLTVERIAFDWRATTPWDSTFSLRGLSLPASVPAAAWHLRLPQLDKVEGSLELTVTGLGGDTFREKLSLAFPALADMDGDVMQTWSGTLNAEPTMAALMGLTLNDAKLRVTDHGLLAYAAGNLTAGRPEALPVLLRQLHATLRDLGNSGEATELTDNLLKFIQNSGTLHIALRKKPLGMLDIITHADNPAALVKTTVTSGSAPLESQLRALFATAPAAKE